MIIFFVFRRFKGVTIMREINLTFRNPDEVLEFVKTVEQYPFDMDLCRGSVVVDAKSLLGIMNLGFNQTVNLKIYSNDCNELFQNIEKYKAA